MEALDIIRMKVKRAGLKTASVIEGCRKLDRNKDGRVHFDDLEMVMIDLLHKKGLELTRREWRHIMSGMTNSPERGDVLYEKLYDVLDSADGVSQEMWYDQGTIETIQLSAPLGSSSPLRTSVKTTNLSPTRRRKVSGPPGSIGEFLEKKGNDSEISNCKKFIHALEKYERDSGMKVEQTGDGLVVPLGPDLKVSISYLG